MPQLANKVVITCAITGSIHTPTMSDALPITPDQIATQSIDAAKAGATILHLHARDPKDGRPSPDPNVFRQFLPRIKQGCDAIINITTGGNYNGNLQSERPNSAQKKCEDGHRSTCNAVLKIHRAEEIARLAVK